MHEHPDLLVAIAAGDAEAAARSTIEQIESARKMVMDAILSAPWFRGALGHQW